MKSQILFTFLAVAISGFLFASSASAGGHHHGRTGGGRTGGGNMTGMGNTGMGGGHMGMMMGGRGPQ
jgi:hypothetical protein